METNITKETDKKSDLQTALQSDRQPEKKKSRKWIPVAASLLVLVIAAVIFIVFRTRKGEGNVKGTVYVEQVSTVTGTGIGGSSRFMGVVESQESKTVKRDSSRKISETLVKTGDTVRKGDPLFTYDTSDMEMTLQQLNLDLQGIQNNIDTDNATIADLTAQRNKAATEDERLSLTSQINQTNAQLSEEKYNLSAKELEIQRQQEAMKDTTVTAPMDGVVKKISSSGSDSDSGASDTSDISSTDTGSEDTTSLSTAGDASYITIMADGEYRIRGTVDEQSVSLLTSGTPVILRSRVDENQTWKGTVGKISQEPQTSQADSYMYGSSNGGETTSKYTFYVEPENSDNLMLGQHLYIEMDYGQEGLDPNALNLPSYYLMQENGKYYVWKEGSDKRIHKTEVTVGEYHEATDTYPVTSGLSKDDYIAFPDDSIQEGEKTTTNYEEASPSDGGYSEDISSFGDAEFEGASMGDPGMDPAGNDMDGEAVIGGGEE